MRKTIGYGFKLKTETFEETLAAYTRGDGFCNTKKEVLADIENGKNSKDIPMNAKPKIFKVVVETQE